jgi:cyanophycinase
MRARIVTLLFSFVIPSALFGQGYICAVGGGSEDYNSWSDAPYRWIVQRADSQSIIILATSAQSSWLPNYFMALGAAQAFNYTIATTATANDSATYRAIRACRGVFIKGGDQWEYVSRWRGTLTEQAIREVFLQGGVVAGTSAGAMVLSEFVSDAQFGSATSRTVLRNPRASVLTLTSNFLRLVPNTIIDTHFHERGRFGRLLTMVANVLHDAGRRIIGIGIEDQTALCIGPDGVGEVMGSGSVTMYYPEVSSFVRSQANQPLIFTRVRCDAMVAGFRYDLHQQRVVYVPPSAVPPQPGTSEPPRNSIILFGDLFPSPTGLTSLFVSAGGTAARVAVISPPASAGQGQRYVDSLLARGVASSSLLLLDSLSANNATYAATIAQASALVFTSNLSEQFPRYTDSTTLVGQALRQRIATGITLAYAHQDAKLAGSKIVFRTELEEYAAYLGKLVLGNGMKALRNLLVMPLIFESSVFDENRCTGLMWGIAQSECKTGLYLDEGGFVTINSSGIVQSNGPTPLVLVDARGATHVGFSTYRAPGSVGPRQSAALVGAMVHVLDGDVRLNALTGEVITGVESVESTPASGSILWINYPNPFNATTQFEFVVGTRTASGSAQSFVRLDLFDILGRHVRTVVNGMFPAGTHRVSFDARDLPSGVYFARILIDQLSAVRRLVVLR